MLHDWNLEKSDGIVRKSFAALNDGGKILIHEMLFDEEVPATSVTAASLSLMMALHGQGRQYTKKEIENLLMKAGFENVSTVRALGPFSLTTGHRKKEI